MSGAEKKNSVQDKRTYARTEVNAAPELTVKRLGETARYPVLRVINFSTSGMKILSAVNFSKGQDVDFKLIIPDRVIKFIATIIYSESSDRYFEQGIQFLTISEANLEKLYDLFIPE